jgi:hypothetical protein
VKTVANLLIALILAEGVPHAGALQSAAGVCGMCSAPQTISLEALRARRPPAEAAASQDGVRAGIANVGRSIASQPGILPSPVVLPALAPSGTSVGAFGGVSAFVSFSSSLVRGPPLAI